MEVLLQVLHLLPLLHQPFHKLQQLDHLQMLALAQLEHYHLLQAQLVVLQLQHINIQQMELITQPHLEQQVHFL